MAIHRAGENSLQPLLCFGEALIDFLHTGSVQADGLDLPDFRQFPGGAPANVAVAFSKLGGQAWFAGQARSPPPIVRGRDDTAAAEQKGDQKEHRQQPRGGKSLF